MIFKPELIAKVLDGTKTMTRRKFRAKSSAYRVGRSYAVQPGRGQAAVARIVVDEVRLEPLLNITQEEARREGFSDPLAFGRYWRGLYGEIDWQEKVYVIGFHLDWLAPVSSISELVE